MLVRAEEMSADVVWKAITKRPTSDDAHQAWVLRERVPFDGDIVLDENGRVLHTCSDDTDERGGENASERDKCP